MRSVPRTPAGGSFRGTARRAGRRSGQWPGVVFTGRRWAPSGTGSLGATARARSAGIGAPPPLLSDAGVVPPRLPVPDGDQRRPVKTTPGHCPERRPARRAVPRKDPPAGVRGTLLIRAGQAVVMQLEPPTREHTVRVVWAGRVV